MAQPIGYSASAQPGTKQPQTVVQANQNPPPPTLLPEVTGALDRIGAALEAQNAKGESPEETKRANADLEAQQSMAFWAKLVVFATIVQAVIGGAGILLLIANLKEARRLTKTALRSNARATRANVIAREAYAAEHRTWLKMTIVEAGPVIFVNDEIRIAVRFKAENIGRNPATNIQFRCRYYQARGYVVPKSMLERLISSTSIYDRVSTALFSEENYTIRIVSHALADEVPDDPAGTDIGIVDKTATPLCLSMAFCVLYKSPASDNWCYTGHIAVLTKIDKTEFDPSLGNVSVDNLQADVISSNSIMA